MHSGNITILTIGYARGLWDSPDKIGDDTILRLSEYAARMKGYHAIVHSLKKHQLNDKRQILPRLFAYPTNARNSVFSFFRMIVFACNLGRSIRFDLVEGQDSYFTGMAAYIVSRMLHIPLSIVVFGPNPFDKNWIKQSFIHRIIAPISRFCLRRSDGILVDGSRTAYSLSAAGINRDRISVRPMIPIDIESYFSMNQDTQLRNELSCNGKFAAIILYAGRIAAQKNLQLLIGIASYILKINTRIRFVIAGDGPQLSELKEITNGDKELKRIFLWLGHRPRAEIIRFMSACDIFVLPSLYEGFPRVLMEAAAAGKPIVTADVSGADDIVINNKSGYIVPINDRSAFLEKICTIINDSQLAHQMGEAGRENMRAIAAKYADPGLQVDIWKSIARRGVSDN